MELDEILEALGEASVFEDELQPYLDALETSSGTILLEESAPPFPCAAIGLVLERRGRTSLLSYDLNKFAVLKQEGFELSGVVYDSVKRFLREVNPSTLSHELEVRLYRNILLKEMQ